MTDNIIRAWAACADPDFGGSLGEEREPWKGATPKSGIPYTYRFRDGWQVRIPGLRARTFKDLESARAFVEEQIG